MQRSKDRCELPSTLNGVTRQQASSVAPTMVPRALVVGGAGFLGKHIVQQLLDSKRYQVRVFDIRECGIKGIEMVTGDLTKLEDVIAASKGIDVVIHVATATPTSENALNKQIMDAVNVKGTQNVIEACKRNKIAKLVYTSSASGAYLKQSIHAAIVIMAMFVYLFHCNMDACCATNQCEVGHCAWVPLLTTNASSMQVNAAVAVHSEQWCCSAHGMMPLALLPNLCIMCCIQLCLRVRTW